MPLPLNFAKAYEDENTLVAKLIARGLKIDDENELRQTLRIVGYYRLPGYLYACLSIQVGVLHTTLFTSLSLCAWLIRVIRPESQWTSRVKDLLADYPEVPLSAMGFPSDWQTLALWQ